MRSDEGARVSVWMESADMPPVERGLRENTEADVCIVGAGIAGLTTAYLLSREGQRVVVLDDGEIGGGETSRTTAHLASAMDDRFTELERLHGREGARLAGHSHAAAIDRIEQIVVAESIDCDLERVDGFLFLRPGDPPDLLDRERDAARRAGLAGVERLPRAPVPFDTGPCLRFPRQGQFHPLRYLAGLARAVRAAGSRIVTGARVDAVEGGRSARVTTASGASVVCRAVLVATNTPINDKVAIHTKQAPYRSYVIACRIPDGAVPHVLLWDTGDPYTYVRVLRLDRRDVLIVGGEDHKTGQADDAEARWQRLWAWTRERFTQAEPPVWRWSGQVMEPVDFLGYIGRNPMDADNVYVATGDSGQGMTHGTIAGMLVTDLVMGRENPWAELYDPSRKTLRAARAFASENVNVAGQYLDWLKPGDVGSEDEVAPGTGALVRHGAHLRAVYRDEAGRLTRLSAVCTHLQCIVAWNAGEKTWDCPCHGSRFGTDGHVLNGPAHHPLERIEDDGA